MLDFLREYWYGIGIVIAFMLFTPLCLLGLAASFWRAEVTSLGPDEYGVIGLALLLLAVASTFWAIVIPAALTFGLFLGPLWVLTQVKRKQQERADAKN